MKKIIQLFNKIKPVIRMKNEEHGDALIIVAVSMVFIFAMLALRMVCE